MLTIKGREWHLVRPSIPYQARVYKDERSQIQSYDKKPRTIKENSGKVISICICLLTGEVLSMAKGIHADVCDKYHIDPSLVKMNGWKLDNGNFVWR